MLTPEAGNALRPLLTRLTIYVRLVWSLFPHVFTTEERTAFNELKGFISDADDAALAVHGWTLIKRLTIHIAQLDRTLPRLVSVEDIAGDYVALTQSRNVRSFGIPVGWLTERFDLGKLGIAKDAPLHARLGTDHHAGRLAIEEQVLLDDAFYFLHCGRMALQHLEQGVANKPSRAEYDRLTCQNSNIGAYARMTVLCFYSFLECFVNSVGFDACKRLPALQEADRVRLQGQKPKGGYLSTEKKLEIYPSILSADHSCNYVISDPAQRKEPFISFCEMVKEIRDSSVHYAPGKQEIWLGPRDWMERAEKACTVVMAVAEQFWRACYGDRAAPEYLNGLDMDALQGIARERYDSADVE